MRELRGVLQLLADNGGCFMLASIVALTGFVFVAMMAVQVIKALGCR